MHYGEIKKCDIGGGVRAVPITVRGVLIRIHGTSAMEMSIQIRRKKKFWMHFHRDM